MTTTQHDAVEHPRHYTNHPSGIECLEITRDLGFDIGNAIKYVWRADLKNGAEDLLKARFYINDYMRHFHAADGRIPADKLRRVAAAEPAGSPRRAFFYALSDGKIGDALDALNQLIERNDAEDNTPGEAK